MKIPREAEELIYSPFLLILDLTEDGQEPTLTFLDVLTILNFNSAQVMPQSPLSAVVEQSPQR